jgi:hypothetical protein
MVLCQENGHVKQREKLCLGSYFSLVSVISSLKFTWRYIFKSGMTSLAVVEAFDVLKNGLFRFFSRTELIWIDAFFLD